MHTGERLARHYASADVFLFPSETETFGNVTLEAMASGLAVVAYNYAGAKMHIATARPAYWFHLETLEPSSIPLCGLVREPQSSQRIRTAGA